MKSVGYNFYEGQGSKLHNTLSLFGSKSKNDYELSQQNQNVSCVPIVENFTNLIGGSACAY